MSQEMIRKNIDEHEYEFFKFGTKKSLSLLMRLSKIVGKPLGMVFGAFTPEPGKKIIDS